MSLMQDVHIRALDLNLLLALDALLAHRHVTRAAKQVGLSQSAMSHALSRLREQLSDPLLVKTSRGMQPTERALALAAPLRAALEQLDRALAPAARFDPKATQRTFRLGLSDYETVTLLSPLLRRLRVEAPNIDVRVQAPHAGAVAEMLAQGELDLVVKPLAKGDALDGIYHQRLVFHERFVVVARKNNPHVQKRLTLKRYVAAPHALVAPGGTPRGIVDELLEQRGLRRRVMLTVPHFLVAPHLLAETDLLITLAERIARRLAPLLELDIHPLPLPLPGFTLHQVWHARTHADPAHRFLRQLMSEVAAQA